MKVLFIGGTGTISTASTKLALARGFDLTLLNRGSAEREIPMGAKVINGDIRDLASARAAIGDERFDVVVDWVAFTPEHIETDLQLFQGRCGHYIFISSASAYQTPPATLPVRESTILDNPYWAYSRNKMACEERLQRAYREDKFPITIIRPSHTYDKYYLPIEGGWTVAERMLRGDKIIVHGDGTSLWTLTHSSDFAKGMVGLLGNDHALGESFHITSDEWLTWNRIHEIIAAALGVKADIVHIPSDLINAYAPDWGASLLGDKAHSFILDNSKIKRLVPDFVCTTPFSRGVEDIINWHMADSSRRVVSKEFDALCGRMLEAYQQAWPK